MSERLRLLAIRCADLERSLQFYQQLLGAGDGFVSERHGSGPVHYSTVLNGTVFELYPHAGPEPVEIQTRIGLAVADVDFQVEFVRHQGAIVREPADSPWGRRAVIRDPDGRAVELYELEPDGQIPLGQAHMARRTAEIIQQILKRPEMYVGPRLEPDALEGVLHIVTFLWAEAAGKASELMNARVQIAKEEDAGTNSYSGVFQERYPSATDEQVVEFVLNCWRRIVKDVGIV